MVSNKNVCVKSEMWVKLKEASLVSALKSTYVILVTYVCAYLLRGVRHHFGKDFTF